jgi:hypothetical protein
MKQRYIDNPLDRLKKTKMKVVVTPDKKGKVIKYNWLQRMIIKLFRL